ncbi:MAG: ribosome silencing factor [Smithellaceae bacterium]|nr:ribosome silencing factor [Smithellaceae bacterium]
MAGKKTDAKAKVLLCVNASLEKQAKELIVLNVKGVSSFADYFVISSGSSDRQVQAISASIQETMKKAGMSPLGVEGESLGKWVLLDYGEVIVHIFYEPIRSFYELERLWADVPRMEIGEDVAQIKSLIKGM